MILPNDVKMILDKIRDNGYLSFVVGGAVRDHLLGKKPTDFDISTSSPPEVTLEIFKDFKLVKTGLKHGTVGIIFHNKMYEVTSFRTETNYKDFRRPNEVAFIDDLYLDLSRRDFTINALCYYDKVIDYFSGVQDLHYKIIRTVNDPVKRFEEDALRILRAIRFSSTLDFSIENKTKKAIFKKKENLKFVSAERVNIEFTKMMEGNIKRLKEFYPVFKIIITGLSKNDFSKSLQLMEKEYPIELNIALLLSGNSKYKLVLEQLKFSKAINKEVSTIIDTKSNNINNDIYDFKILFNKYKYDTVINILNFHHLMFKKEFSFKLINLAYSSCYSIKQLKINGNDLIELNVPKDKRSQLLKEVLDEIIKSKLENEKPQIIEYIKKQLYISETYR